MYLSPRYQRYYESAETTRNGKVVETLETVGASILGGGLSTAMSVLPLAFSTSEILRTVFTCFFIMIAVAVTHGLMFFPVLLSICGPRPRDAANNKGIFMESSKDTETNERSDTDDSSDDEIESTQSQKREQSHEFVLVIKASDVESTSPSVDSSRRLVVKASDEEPSTPTVGTDDDGMSQFQVIRTTSMSQNESLEVIVAF